MAKLYFYYASMNAGKSTTLLQADFNYRERGMATMLWTAQIDNRGSSAIESRIGLAAGAHRFTPETDLYAAVLAANPKPACVLIDEAQFLTTAQVWQAARIADGGGADEAGIPVLCYGLRTDFAGELFPGSAALLGIADALVELRVDAQGKAVIAGAQTEIGGNDRYVALCRKHFVEAREARP